MDVLRMGLRFANILLVLNAFCGVGQANLHLLLKEQPLCGDWMSYRDEKCLKIVQNAGTQTKVDAEVICNSYADVSKGESLPHILTIKSKEEKEFVQRFLFVESDIVDNVWLGLAKNRNSGLFSWSDGSELLSFNNWANQSLSDDQHECVEMESGEGILDTGLWFKVTCRRRNAVVCERRPSWSFETLQNMFLNFKVEQEKKQNEFALKQQEMELIQKEWIKTQKYMEEEIRKLKYNSVPLGFIYIQLAYQVSPTILWPSAKWLDVSSYYSGLFFRVAGANASQFGEIQEESSPRLKQIERISSTADISHSPLPVPHDGSWSNYISTGLNSRPTLVLLRFQLSSEEVHPRNQAVKIWQRIQ